MSANLAAKEPWKQAVDASAQMYVTMRVDQQLFGVPVRHVRDVLKQQAVTVIPLAPEEIAGSLNLRGRIVTVLDMRKRLQLPPREIEGKNMFVVVELRGELYSLMVDSVGEVLSIDTGVVESTPANLRGCWKEIATGVHKLADELLVIVEVQNILAIGQS